MEFFTKILSQLDDQFVSLENLGLLSSKQTISEESFLKKAKLHGTTYIFLKGTYYLYFPEFLRQTKTKLKPNPRIKKDPLVLAASKEIKTTFGWGFYSRGKRRLLSVIKAIPSKSFTYFEHLFKLSDHPYRAFGIFLNALEFSNEPNNDTSLLESNTLVLRWLASYISKKFIAPNNSFLMLSSLTVDSQEYIDLETEMFDRYLKNIPSEENFLNPQASKYYKEILPSIIKYTAKI